MEWLYILVAGLVAAFFSIVRANGKQAGKKEEQIKSAEVVQEFEEEVANAKMETENAKPLRSKLSSLRERIAKRRGVG